MGRRECAAGRVDGNGGVMPGLGLHQMAPERYAALEHPGDAYAYDIFSRPAARYATCWPIATGCRSTV